MEVPNDFKELLELLNSNKVEYLVVGAFALAHHGAPRFTGDLDILIKPDNVNANNVIVCLNEFGFASLGLKPTDFSEPHQVIQLGVAPVRVDLITSLTGISWEEAFESRTVGMLGGVVVFYIGKDAIIKNKKALGRHKDLADIEALGE